MKSDRTCATCGKHSKAIICPQCMIDAKKKWAELEKPTETDTP